MSFLHSGSWKMIPPLSYNEGFTVHSYGETNRSKDSCHWKDSLLLIVPERRAHTMAQWVLWRSSRVSGDGKEERTLEKPGKGRSSRLLSSQGGLHLEEGAVQ